MKVELEHCSSKSKYTYINNHNPERDIGKLHRRVELLRYLDNSRSCSSIPSRSDNIDADEAHKMSKDSSDSVSLAVFTALPRGGVPDPAKRVCNVVHHTGYITLNVSQNFVKTLKSYALRWTSNMAMMPDITCYDHFSDEQRGHIDVVSNALYQHKTLQLKYTTYDMQEDTDMMRQGKYPGIMILADDQEHPYQYASIIGLFHINVRNNGPDTLLPNGAEASLPMVWVRWFRHDETQGPSGFRSLRYPSVSFCNSNEPDEIIRAVHLIPRFAFGRTEEYLSVPSKGRPEAEHSDWKHFSINM